MRFSQAEQQTQRLVSPIDFAMGASGNTEAELDVLHISIAAVHGMSYLATWNCKHINSAILKKKLREEILTADYTEVDITTPDELGR
ncbi:MAG: hypothetical protein LBU79_02535 [Planctomycetota bacterium]|jgi:hypothetical protein|nr:hypothetical protein [Planctomycetota bacterium]